LNDQEQPIPNSTSAIGDARLDFIAAELASVEDVARNESGELDRSI